MKFRYNQKVIITKGFYKTYKGFIKDVNEKDLTYNVEVDLQDKTIKINLKENEIKASWF